MITAIYASFGDDDDNNEGHDDNNKDNDNNNDATKMVMLMNYQWSRSDLVISWSGSRGSARPL